MSNSKLPAGSASIAPRQRAAVRARARQASSERARPHDAGVQRRLPQVDGLRGLALIGMLAWHAEINWVKGGFARMTVFFVLAGYLAYGAFQRERETGNPHPLRTYWLRRVRRLMPVTLVGVALALVVTALVGSASARSSAGWDTIATLTSWINWRFIAQQHSYADLFTAPTAFEHFWSLSLEEQCFLATPLLAAFALRFGNGRPGRALLLGAVAISAVPAFWKQSPDVVYYGTHVRIGEFAAGAALAAILPLHVRRRNERSIRITRWLSPLSLATLIIVMLTVPRTLPWLYRGGIGLMIVPAAGILAGAVVGERVTTSVLSVRPLVSLGRAALSIYAIHWPLFVLIDQGVPSLRGVLLQVVQLSVSIGAGLALFKWFEQPLMRSGDSQRIVRAVLVVGASLIIAAWVVPSKPAGLSFEQQLARQEARLQAANRSGAALGAGGAIVFASFGGSAALPLTFAGDSWFIEHKTELVSVPGDAQLGCGLLLGGSRFSLAMPVDATAASSPDESSMSAPGQPCVDQPALWPTRIRTLKIDTALVVGSTWDIGTWAFDTSKGTSLVPGDAEFDRRLRTAMTERFDSMRAAGLSRLLVTNLNRSRSDLTDEQSAEWERRLDVYDAILKEVAATRPWISVIDQRAYTMTLDDQTFARYFPDGVHISIDDGLPVWKDLIGPALLER